MAICAEREEQIHQRPSQWFDGGGMGIGWQFAILTGCLLTVSGAWAQDLKVTLLGTGSPLPIVDRFGAATLVEGGPGGEAAI